MSHVIEDRVRESTTTTGSGNITLLGAQTGFKTFASVCANNDTVDYVIDSNGGAEWEVGLGTWQTGGTLVRTTVRRSSNANAAVVFSAGTKNVYIDINAARFTRSFAAQFLASFSSGAQTVGAAFTKVTGFTVHWDPFSNWSAADQWYVVPYSGSYEIVTLLRYQDASPSAIYGHGVHTSLADFPGFLWEQTNTVGAARNGSVNIRQDAFNAGDHILVETYFDSGSPGTVDACSISICWRPDLNI